MPNLDPYPHPNANPKTLSLNSNLNLRIQHFGPHKALRPHKYCELHVFWPHRHSLKKPPQIYIQLKGEISKADNR